ncbi:argininosuccinate synthase [Desulfurobacterium indicum]|uniref:Argininosuccinate synthase n=1 Tax=Desulfurobacterium indicum TaxID=1914305 RepID=A0A1R1MKS3_9BACT|nr:argininosuccinate synthase [Desulfurobacterium indicum]OMH40407.1 argininosuccinate synthase [Desulfurobacterium indicum]
MGKRVVLAYSGGLDTSVIVRWLTDRGFEVITYTADVGQGEELSEIEPKAKMAGAVEAVIDDIKEEFVREYCMPLMRAGALYEGKYPLLSALSRPLIAKKLVELAHKVGADYVAHGSTGKGNDQVRFEASVWALDPDIEVLAPVREWEFKSRNEEIEYAAKHGIPVVATKEKPYSYDRNLWGVAIESGPLEDLETEPPEDAFVLTVSPLKAPDEPEYVEIEFKEGIPIAINGKNYSELWKLVWDLNEIAGKHGFGRIDMVENRLVGIKTREVYESPAGLILIRAYDELESVVLDRFTYHYKITHVRHPYAEVVYNGLWFTTLRESLDAFNNNIAKLITGKVRFKLYKGNATVVGRNAENSMYLEDLATYSPKDAFDHKAGAAFTKVWSLPLKVAGRVRRKS